MRRFLLTLALALPGLPAAAGEIAGQGGHAAAGTVELVETEAGRALHFGEDFVLAPGGRPEVVLVRGGEEVVLGPVETLEGAQDHPLPVGAGEFDYMMIRCFIDGRVLATAMLDAASEPPVE